MKKPELNIEYIAAYLTMKAICKRFSEAIKEIKK